MVYYCPQCGARVMQGASVCPMCAAQLKLVIQTAGDPNSNYGSTAKQQSHLNTRLNTINYAEIVQTSRNESATPSIKYNEHADPNNVVEQSEDNEISITGLEGLEDFDDAIDAEARKVLLQGVATEPTKVGTELTRYKVITQACDKKDGIDGAELEAKLNMYAKLGYRIVPNTTICQPGQDFFALLERVSPDVQPKPAQSQTAKAGDIPNIVTPREENT